MENKPKLTDQLNLNLPIKKEKKNYSAAILLILIVIGLVSAINMYILYNLKQSNMQNGSHTPSLETEPQKELAMKLESRGLALPAIEAWQEYLESTIDQKDAASIWYRIGKLYQYTDKHDYAVESFYSSEMLDKGSEYKKELSRQIQETFEALGKVSSLKHELTERTGIDEKAAETDQEVIAEIGAEKITSSQMDQLIEHEVEQALRSYARVLPEEGIAKQKNALLKRFESPHERLGLINQLIAEEVLYRKAREMKLNENEKVRELLRDTERKMLAGELIDKTVSEQVKITEGDIKLYYDANIKDYLQPDRIQISHIQVKDKAAAQKVLDRLKEKAASFEDLAKEISEDVPTKNQGGAIQGWINRNDDIPAIGKMPELFDEIFSLNPGS
ncbi:MAG: peptidyl-prolyl cis-trans isomerase, partial [Pseudomonadota bacterium]